MNLARTFLLSIALLSPTAAVPLLADEQRAKAPGADASGKLELNTANQRALERVPEIGPEAARAIVAARPFATIDELDRVKGITAEQLEQIRAKVYVSAPAAREKLGEPSMRKKPLGAPSTSAARQSTLDINTADVSTLAANPAIGEDGAKAIVAARPFKSLDELNRLKGLSAERLEQIRAVLTIAPPRSGRSAP